MGMGLDDARLLRARYCWGDEDGSCRREDEELLAVGLSTRSPPLPMLLLRPLLATATPAAAAASRVESDVVDEDDTVDDDDDGVEEAVAALGD